jgi:hypothetical protein
LIAFKFIFQGHIQSIAPNKGFGEYTNKLAELIEVLNKPKFIDYLDHVTAIELIDVINIFI